VCGATFTNFEVNKREGIACVAEMVGGGPNRGPLELSHQDLTSDRRVKHLVHLLERLI
jgi:hypothetical protein